MAASCELSTLAGVVQADHKYVSPQKEIRSQMDMKKWQSSQAYSDFVGFLQAMNEKVKGRKMSDECHISEVTEGLLNMLDKFSKWVDDIPPIEQPQRFGNKAFRTFFKQLEENAESVLKEALPDTFHTAVQEISIYLIESVGNSTRIDYGTGHEAAFAVLLLCLFKIGALKESDSEAVVLRVFTRYLDLARKLQLTYRMEPAGSHGSWSLDDYQFIPFIWGSSQLRDHPVLFPKDYPDPVKANEYANDYMFMTCIKFIHKVKTGVFAEHSNQLWNISGVPYWDKVNSGFLKMYRAEVLGKFPVVQHIFFGSLFSIEKSVTPLPPRYGPPQ